VTERGGAHPADFAATLRQAFDQSFAAPAVPVSDDRETLLHVLVGSAPYAIRVSEIQGLVVDAKVAPLPTPVPGLLGVAGVRGAIVAVYHLQSFVGGGEPASIPRWMVIARAAPIALAFDALSGHLRVNKERIVKQAGATHVQEAAVLDGTTAPIVSLAIVADSITSRIRAAAGRKE
jgi:purine-binding chemotaxis protein CheW